VVLHLEAGPLFLCLSSYCPAESHIVSVNHWAPRPTSHENNALPFKKIP
jgi:hypothetical protein